MFWLDQQKTKFISYEDLIRDVNKKNTFKKYINYKDPYEIYLDLLLSIINRKEVTLLDSTLTIDELKYQEVDIEDLEYNYNNSIKITCIDELLLYIKSVKDWSVNLFTSGTTGKPKKINHTTSVMLRNIIVSDKHKSDVWALAYHPTHFAALQVFFQAILNKNPLIYIFETPTRNVNNILRDCCITHISATPTFVRKLLSYHSHPITNIVQITLGGEKFDENLRQGINSRFPNAVLKNIYASTEIGSLFISNGEVFFIPDKIRQLVRFSSEHELLIHKKLIANDISKLNGDWFSTGDKVEVLDSSSFKIIGRINESLIVAGYLVDPIEIEEAIGRIEGVREAVVYARSNMITGNLVTVDLVIDKLIDKHNVIKSINDLPLQKWKIPRIINFVESILKTKSGKKVRRHN